MKYQELEALRLKLRTMKSKHRDLETAISDEIFSLSQQLTETMAVMSANGNNCAEIGQTLGCTGPQVRTRIGNHPLYRAQKQGLKKKN